MYQIYAQNVEDYTTEFQQSLVQKYHAFQNALTGYKNV